MSTTAYRWLIPTSLTLAAAATITLSIGLIAISVRLEEGQPI